VRSADLILFVISPFEIESHERLSDELYDNKVRLDREPPSVSVTRKGKGGIRINASDDFELSEGAVTEVLREHGVVNADVTIRGDLDIDELIDGVMDNRVYLPSIVALNKADLIDGEYADTVHEELEAHGLDPEEVTFISAENERGLDALTDRIWDALGLIRIYMDKPGRGVDYEEPLILRKGDTVGDACETLGGEFADGFRFARVTGPSAKHDEQQVGTDHELKDEDVLRITTTR